MSTLIVGGTSGLGLELARNMAAQNEEAIITGRHDPNVGFAEYREFDLTTDNLPARIGQFVMDLPPIKSLIYAAGFPQLGHITELSDEDIDNMFDVGGRGLVFFVKKVLEKQDKLDELVTITSTSQWTPREYEPVYNFVKAGAAHYSHGQSLDPRIRKTLVVGPSGMDTEFWDETGKDTSFMMQPEWVAQRIMELRQRDDSYVFAKILGATGNLPNRVEVVEPYKLHHRAVAVAALIRSRRLDLGLKSSEVAKEAGMSRNMYIQIENAKPQVPTSTKQWRPSRKSLLYIADALGFKDEEILTTAGYELDTLQ